MRRTSSTWAARLVRIERDERGLTLIEVAVALMIMAIILAVAVPAFESASGDDLRGAAAKLAAVARACDGEATVKNTTLRIAYDLDHGAWWIEAYPGAYQVSGATDQDLDRFRDMEKEKADAEKRKKELESRLSESSAEDEQKGAPAPKFVPVALDFVSSDVLPRGVRIVGVRTPQFRQVIKSGKAYTHFFPNGWAEHTLVYLKDAHDNEITLEMEPMSGRVIVWDGELDFRDVENRHDKGESGSSS